MVPESAGHDSGHGTPKIEVHVQEYSPPIRLIVMPSHTLLSLMFIPGPTKGPHDSSTSVASAIVTSLQPLLPPQSSLTFGAAKVAPLHRPCCPAAPPRHF